MPRTKREDYPSAWHHVFNRGTRREKIFLRPEHCLKFLDIVAEAVDRFGFEVHAYSLMPNHYHLLVRSPAGNLSRCMRHISGVYTQWLNQVQGWEGPVFRGRYKSQLVEDEGYLRLLVAYLHLNPVRAGLVSRLEAEAWTSHRAYLGKEPAPNWLTLNVMKELFGSAIEIDRFVWSVQAKAIEYPPDFDHDTGLFRKKAVVRRICRANEPPEVATPATVTRFRDADDVLKAVCELTDSGPGDLMKAEAGPGANPARRFAIWALHRSAGLTHREIAGKLRVAPFQVSKLLSRLRKETPDDLLRGWMDTWLARE